LLITDEAHADIALVSSPACAEHVVFIDKGYLTLELIIDAHANWAHWVRGRGINICERAVVSSEVVPELIANHTMEVSHVKVSGIAIEFPVGHTISNHEALEVGHPLARWLSSVNETINSQCELRDVDASIGFTRDVEGVVLNSCELILEEIQHCQQVVISRVVIVKDAL
jgi:hypothetical protein